MATKYIEFYDALILHLLLMKRCGETRYGMDDRSLIESALARLKHSATYENADIIRQSATLYYGLIKNHPWLGGNKRTATAIIDEFLYRNGFEITAKVDEIIKLVLAIEADKYQVSEIENWLRKRVSTLK